MLSTLCASDVSIIGVPDLARRCRAAGVTPIVIIPVRPFELGKSRLAGTLGPVARHRLNRALFDHVLGVASAVVGAGRCLVVSGAEEVLARADAAGAPGLAERGDGLNPALHQARDAALATGAEIVVTLSTDLPLLDAGDLDALIDAGRSHPVVIATDRHGTGTNALWLAGPRGFRFRYGPGSRAAHEAEAIARGTNAAVVTRHGLSHDIDEPADLRLFLPKAFA